MGGIRYEKNKKDRRTMDGLKYDIFMDMECILLCDALNELPDVETFESCCGHFENPYQIWFKTKNPYSVAVIARAIDRRYSGIQMDWMLNAETLDSKSDPQYCYNLHSVRPYADYNEMMDDVRKLAENIEYWKSPNFYKYFKFNQ